MSMATIGFYVIFGQIFSSSWLCFPFECRCGLVKSTEHQNSWKWLIINSYDLVWCLFFAWDQRLKFVIRIVNTCCFLERIGRLSHVHDQSPCVSIREIGFPLAWPKYGSIPPQPQDETTEVNEGGPADVLEGEDIGKRGRRSISSRRSNP